MAELPESAAWRHLDARDLSAAAAKELRLERDRAGQWLIDGRAAQHLAGCLDVDLEASAYDESGLVLDHRGLAVRVA